MRINKKYCVLYFLSFLFIVSNLFTFFVQDVGVDIFKSLPASFIRGSNLIAAQINFKVKEENRVFEENNDSLLIASADTVPRFYNQKGSSKLLINRKINALEEKVEKIENEIAKINEIRIHVLLAQFYFSDGDKDITSVVNNMMVSNQILIQEKEENLDVLNSGKGKKMSNNQLKDGVFFLRDSIEKLISETIPFWEHEVVESFHDLEWNIFAVSMLELQKDTLTMQQENFNFNMDQLFVALSLNEIIEGMIKLEEDSIELLKRTNELLQRSIEIRIMNYKDIPTLLLSSGEIQRLKIYWPLHLTINDIEILYLRKIISEENNSNKTKELYNRLIQNIKDEEEYYKDHVINELELDADYINDTKSGIHANESQKDVLIRKLPAREFELDIYDERLEIFEDLF